MRLPWELRVNVDTQFALRRPVHGGLLQNQLPQPVLFCGSQDIVIIQYMLGGRDDRKGIPVSLCAGFLLP